MKNVIKTSMLTAVLLSTLLGNANKGSSFVPKKETDFARTMVTINDVRKGQELTIKDDNGLVLYRELIKVTGNYNKTFDLTELPDGDYFFEVDKDLEIKSIPFTVASKKVIFNKDQETTIYKPYIRFKDNYIYLNKLALHEEPLEVRIYYGDDELIYSETIKNTQNISKAYKLLKYATGSYKIELQSDGRTYYQYITL